MPLSEQEQRAIEALEQGLYEQDPAFVNRVSSQFAFINVPFRLAFSVVGFVGGLALMLAFCLSTAVMVGLAGFLVMFASLYTFWVNTGRLRQAKLDDPARSEGSGRTWRSWRRR